MDFILERISHTPIRAELELDLTLARGLNYYTGAIFEVKALDVQIGSITGGGRYDNLTGVFGMEGVQTESISFFTGLTMRWFRDAFCAEEKLIAERLGVDTYTLLEETIKQVLP